MRMRSHLRNKAPSGTLPCLAGTPPLQRARQTIMERAEYLVMAEVEGYHWWYGGMRAITASVLDRAYAGRRDLHILDAGCGSGGNMRFLRRYGSVVGIDLAAEALALGRGSLQGGLAQA